MTKYNYLEAVKEDVKNYIDSEINFTDFDSLEELENKLIDEFYSLNQEQFCDDLENFTDYFLSEHTILLKTYIYDILDSFTAEKLKNLIFK